MSGALLVAGSGMLLLWSGAGWLAAVTAPRRRYWLRAVTFCGVTAVGFGVFATSVPACWAVRLRWPAAVGCVAFGALLSAAVAVFLAVPAALLLVGWSIDRRTLQSRALSWSKGKLLGATAVCTMVYGASWPVADALARSAAARMADEAHRTLARHHSTTCSDTPNAATVYEELIDSWEPLYSYWAWISQPAYREPVARALQRCVGRCAQRAASRDPARFVAFEIKRILTENAEPLRRLRLAASWRCCHWPTDESQLRYPVDDAPSAPLSQAAVLLALSARYHAARGTVPLAIRDLRAMHGLARHADDGTLDGLRISVEIWYTLIHSLLATLETGNLTRADVGSLEFLWEPPSLPDRMQPAVSYELARAYGLLSRYALGTADHSETVYVQTAYRTAAVAPRRRLLWRLHGLRVEANAVRLNARLAVAVAASGNVPEGNWWRHPGAPVASRIFELFRWFDPWASEDLRRVARVLTAVYVYHLDHGRYPEHIAQLVPRYISRVPRSIISRAPYRLYRSASCVVVSNVVSKSSGWKDQFPYGRSVELHLPMLRARPGATQQR